MKGRHVSVYTFVFVVRVTYVVTQIHIHTRDCRHGRWEIILEVLDQSGQLYWENRSVGTVESKNKLVG